MKMRKDALSQKASPSCVSELELKRLRAARTQGERHFITERYALVLFTITRRALPFPFPVSFTSCSETPTKDTMCNGNSSGQ